MRSLSKQREWVLEGIPVWSGPHVSRGAGRRSLYGEVRMLV